MDDTQLLVTQAQEGSQEAFGKLVALYHDKIYGQVFRMLKNEDDAQEVTQITWIKTWNKISTFRGDSAFSSWVYRIATFTALDLIRKRKRKQETELHEEFETGNAFTSLGESIRIENAAPIKELERKEIAERFQEALQQLPEKHRSALILREVEGYSYKEIAERLACKTGTVMSRIFNARKAIQGALKDFVQP